jgi:hypothetical protein
LGVNVQKFEAKDKRMADISLDNILLNQIYLNYKNLGDKDLKIVANSLKPSYIITENRKIEIKEFELVYKVNNYRIYQFL